MTLKKSLKQLPIFLLFVKLNPIQLKAIADFVEEEVKKKCGENPYKHEGRQGEQWILIDYVNVVVHIMLPEPESFTDWKKCGAMHQSLEH